MASAGAQLEDIRHLQESPSDAAFGEAQKWIEQVTGRSFGYKNFRAGLENGVLLCELLNAIKPGLVKKINRLPTPIAGLDNVILFLRGCKELGLKDSQLFDPSDLQDTSARVTVKSTDCNRKLKNVLVTIYWLGKAANNCTSFNGATLNLKEFEGLLTQMRKETEDIESPKRSIRDSGYIDCWDSERSDSLSPPRHGRDDSFDSLDSFGSRSQQTPSPDVVLRGSSDGRGSDSESDFPHRRIPDMKKDDMLTRRTSHGEIKTFVPFNQYLPNKTNQTAYVPAPLRKKKAEREEYRKSWSTATSPLGGERPFSENHPETIMEEQSEALQCEKDEAVQEDLRGEPATSKIENNGSLDVQSSAGTIKGIQADECEAKEVENRKLKIREQAGIKVMSAAKRFESPKQVDHESETPDIILRKENAFLTHYAEPSEDEEEDRIPDIEKDDLATRKVRMDQTKTTPGYNHVSSGSYTKKDGKWEDTQKPSPSELLKIHPCTSKDYGPAVGLKSILTQKKGSHLESEAPEFEEEEQEKVPDIQRDDLANRKNQYSHSRPQEGKNFINASITEKDLKTWERLKLSTEARTMASSSCLPNMQLRAPSPLRVERDRASGQKEGGECKEEYLPAFEEESRATRQALTQPNQSEDRVLQGPELQDVPEEKDKVVLRFSPRSALSDDMESMSMFDMRDEEEAAIQPHSRAYQDELQNVNSLLKEEDDKWQDDLARWKSRRRSASQDLIKKEEERRKMEKVLSGEYDLSERRKSIKTYKEIVEEKERRERELHEAYLKAKSREEAEMVLQKYIEKFTISEAILERLQMPKLLERRHSVESNSLSPPKETSPMKYLRQQSLPVPKFTATFQATIASPNESETAVLTDFTSPNKATVAKAVPVLTPKPYSPPKNKQGLKTFKVDGRETMNGEVCNGTLEKERCATFAPSPDSSLVFEGVAKVDESPLELKQDTTHVELTLKRPKSNSVCRELTDTIQEETEGANQREESASEMSMQRPNLGHASQEGLRQSEKTSGHFGTAVSSLEFTPIYHTKEYIAKKKDENRGEKETDVPVTEQVVTSKACNQEDSRAFEYFKTGAEICQDQQGSPHLASVPLRIRNSWRRSQFFSQSVDSNSSEEKSVLIPPENASRRCNLWSWDPEEERKRQERWQQEQERMLQERYQKEQEKLKEEWEKAQKEVEEEERKYYEEERKIIEDTVVPFTTTSSFADLPASSSSSLEAQMNRNFQSLERPLPKQEPEQELKESQMQVAESSSRVGQAKEKKTEVVREQQQDLMWDLDEGSFHRSQEGEMQKEKRSVNKMIAGHQESLSQKMSEQRQQRLMTRQDLPAKMNLNLLPDASWDHQLMTKEPSCASNDVSLKTPPLDYGLGHQAYSLGGIKRTASPESIRAGLASPSSPSQLCQSPNRYQRSVSGKKLCSSCGLPLGKGAAMIIDTLNLYFHIQCFKCGICKGELGDVTTGTDVRIRNGLLNCNDCYIRSRTAGQPTPL
uniref:LIM and calponin homology domains-containing protein 1 isoform X8 n=1 Tax=Geotrypetes seraphini TaxID=260995 RepID=A0A6P8R322_GEOSA|nr:LIM and calponin homology domains-containing protein 1 isoform X8 [Geotrypetes seraphini]